jgi:transcriptional regulator with XRE-family HTH domain
VRTEKWDRETFRTVLAAIRDRTHLTELELANLAGRSRSQVNRWTRAENQPDYEPVRRLVDGLEQYGPQVRQLGVQLLEAAGYSPPEPTAHVSQANLTVSAPPEPGVQVERYDDNRHVHLGVTVDTQVTMEEAIASLGDLSPHEQGTIDMLRNLRYEPAEVAGAILLLRGLDARRAAQSGSDRRNA